MNSAQARRPRVECPRCGSADVEPLYKRGLLNGPFTITAPRRCRQCGLAFEPPAGRLLAVVVTLFGLGSIVMPWPNLVRAIAAKDACLAMMDGFLVLACVSLGWSMVAAGIRSLLGTSKKSSYSKA